MSALPAAFLDAIGLAAPGLPDWTSSQAILRGEQPYIAAALPPYLPTLLPANERRRACAAIRTASRAAEQAVDGCNPAGLATVFASSETNLHIAARLCTALADGLRQVSPTDFHASVHNAAAGNWSIGTRSQQPSTAVAGWENCFATGLMEAVAMVAAEQADTLLVTYDLEPPAIMSDRSLATQGYAMALRLSPRATARTLARLQLQTAEATATTMTGHSLAAMHMSCPAARSLPLLEVVALRRSATVFLQHGNHPGSTALAVSVEAL